MYGKLKDRLRSGEILLGACIETPEPDYAEVMGLIGFDWLWIDMEHCPFSIKDVETTLQALQSTDAGILVRVPWNDFVYIKRVLDLGPDGVIVPWINSSREAEEAVEACRYPPEGIRGCGPRRVAWRRGFEEYVKNANKEVVVVLQIETGEAVRNLDEILKVDGVDATFIGPADLSANLGHIGELDNTEVLETIREVLRRHEGKEICPGIAATPGSAQRYIEMGFRLVSVGSDLGFMRMKAEEILRKLRSLLKG
ncbi:4-hydroxy-2-oxo-heptane-1,7-dioate aldolase [Candidatus Bathyarchaeota archaeon ex4484_205]|nr:MAG: 4-hydroxy-2-oxo-heptane-1,7-dioate aldolase [Candidatus Bathyarchaeota archaeon ex4484_205]